MLTTEQMLAQFPGAFERVERKIQQDEKTEQWLKDRAGRITSSQVGKLFTKTYNTSQSKTAQDYINERVAERLGSRKPGFRSAATNWGHDHEHEAIDHYLQNVLVGDVINRMWFDPECDDVINDQQFIKYGDHAGGTPDGIILDVENNAFATLQVKCPYNPGVHAKYLQYDGWEDFKSNEQEYYCQMQSEILFARTIYPDVNEAHFYSYDPRQSKQYRGCLIIIPADEPFLRIMQVHLENMGQEIENRFQKIQNRFK